MRQLLQALPSKPLNNGYPQQKRLLSSPCSPKKEVLQSIKRYMEKKNLIFLKFLLSFIDTQIDDTASKADALIRRMLKKYK